MIQAARKTIVLIGHGMVGHRFCEKMVALNQHQQFRIVVFCEEPRAAYDRVGLTKFFDHRDAEALMIADTAWYKQHGIELHIGEKVASIDRENKRVISSQAKEIVYDYAVLATGSYPFVPPIPGVDKEGVFVYRTIEDLENIIAYARHAKSAAVIGGGLLGLEAAKAASDLDLKTHVVEFAPRLMPRQIDDRGSAILVKAIESLGVDVHLNMATDEILGETSVHGMRFKDGQTLDVDMVIVSAGIRPRDELAKACGIEVGQRGGVVVNDQMQTSDPAIFAIGEIALHHNFIYGLIAPGWDMAEVLARHIAGEDAAFEGGDLSTKLKLMGVDVASFGDYELEPDQAQSLVYEDAIKGVYKKLFFSLDSKRLLGGILVGDASDYGILSVAAKTGDELTVEPDVLIGMGGGGADLGGVDAMSEEAQICSCNNVSKGDICNAIQEQELSTIGDVKACTQAGTGCGGCMPLVTDLFDAEMKKSGRNVKKVLCEHFPYTRQEIYEIIRVKGFKTFDELLEHCGTGQGCEVCKPAVTSILAGLWNEPIIEEAHHTLQDSNDRYLANTQRGGLYSVIPRVPGGEITPDRLITLGEVAKEFNLYTKITGGQRIDLFGAQIQDLPVIWGRLVEAGFESGHAYGKAVRTVKSCVGTTWCRFGVQDSVKMAIDVENRYRGIRAPHKLKFAVSGCTRECAEAQVKDVGLIATENGYNLYVCGNGGMKPRHADLLAADLDAETAIRYIDRFLIYYIRTADKLTRTSVWMEKLEGGLDHLRDVVIEDKLGICDELEKQMQHLVDTYQCEWAVVVNDPEKQKLFRQFVNTDESEPIIDMVDERGQSRPEYWQKEGENHLQQLTVNGQTLTQARQDAETRRVTVGKVWDFPKDGGAAVKVGKSQIAIYHFATRGDQWYATQNMCPHKKAFVLSRGIIGNHETEAGDIPKVACPLHKKQFSLESGECISGDNYRIETFPVSIEGDDVILELPPEELLDAAMATGNFCESASGCGSC